jgi:hypothetical protein
MIFERRAWPRWCEGQGAAGYEKTPAKGQGQSAMSGMYTPPGSKETSTTLPRRDQPEALFYSSRSARGPQHPGHCHRNAPLTETWAAVPGDLRGGRPLADVPGG